METIIVDFYDGAYGPTIRLETSRVELLETFKSLFLSLSAKRVLSARLRDLAFVTMSPNVADIELFVCTAVGEPYKTLRLLSSKLGPPSFKWSRSVEGWLECAELLDGLVETRRPGHQYLNLPREGVDDA